MSGRKKGEKYLHLERIPESAGATQIKEKSSKQQESALPIGAIAELVLEGEPAVDLDAEPENSE